MPFFDVGMQLSNIVQNSMEINSVFTPRNSEVNLKMYVPRLGLERDLLRSVFGSMHSLLFGESGNGKSWLYKKVFNQNGIKFAVANCANASRLGSITEEICNALIPSGTPQKVGHSENKEAAVKAIVAEGKISSQSQYVVTKVDPLFESFRKFRSDVGNAQAVLVLDNLESILGNTSLMNELADIIILLDDSKYSAFKIKLLIVGVPNGTLEFFATTKSMESVSNRIEELPKVTGMTIPEVTTLITMGFKLLKISLNGQEAAVAKHTHYLTMGVPQRVHEYCEKLAYAISDQSIGYSEEILAVADQAWLRVGLRQAYTVLEAHLNSKRTSIARKNQVIFAISTVKVHQFDAGQIANLLREKFPSKTTDSNMGIGAILGDLTSGAAPLLTKNKKANSYRVVDPRYTMCIRAALFINPVTKVVEKKFFTT